MEQINKSACAYVRDWLSSKGKSRKYRYIYCRIKVLSKKRDMSTYDGKPMSSNLILQTIKEDTKNVYVIQTSQVLDRFPLCEKHWYLKFLNEPITSSYELQWQTKETSQFCMLYALYYILSRTTKNMKGQMWEIETVGDIDNNTKNVLQFFRSDLSKMSKGKVDKIIDRAIKNPTLFRPS
jgi:hypothetical protein